MNPDFTKPHFQTWTTPNGRRRLVEFLNEVARVPEGDENLLSFQNLASRVTDFLSPHLELVVDALTLTLLDGLFILLAQEFQNDEVEMVFVREGLVDGQHRTADSVGRAFQASSKKVGQICSLIRTHLHQHPDAITRIADEAVAKTSAIMSRGGAGSLQQESLVLAASLNNRLPRLSTLMQLEQPDPISSFLPLPQRSSSRETRLARSTPRQDDVFREDTPADVLLRAIDDAVLGRGTLAAYLTGSGGWKAHEYSEWDYFARLGTSTLADVEKAIDDLVASGFASLRGSHVRPVVRLTDKGIHWLESHEGEPPDISLEVLTQSEAQLVAALKHWRVEMSKQRRQGPSVVLNQNTINAILRYRPRTLEDLRRCGFSDAKVAEDGEVILRLVFQYLFPGVDADLAVSMAAESATTNLPDDES